ncbi:hypothetical protein C1645_825472 [Glomus cerebriforme]|uniref:Uncharacterized protein n=1 Tax=Glomus cerebriforme TaxID=658196 RepID=A0A397SVH9_9GLOM|nr:hypothetical protein C1645_825472 [Glomus cerebriforme]
MELENSTKKVENKDMFVKQHNYDTFSVNRLQLCFTRGINFIRLYYTEMVSSRSPEEEKEEKKHLGTRLLARTSGNILQVDNKGRVTSVLKEVENELLKQKKKRKQMEKKTIKLEPDNFADPNEGLQIENFDFGLNDGLNDRLNDFSLKVYWSLERLKTCESSFEDEGRLIECALKTEKAVGF